MTGPAAPAFHRTRPVVAGRHGAVATAHPLATLAGLEVLQQGGNAVDAVVAAATTLSVVEPYMSGPGGVGFLLLRRADGTSRVLNFGSHAPARATPDQFTYSTRDHGIRASLIPSCVAGWFEMLSAEGSVRAPVVFQRAIALARDGFPLHPFNVQLIESSLPRLDRTGLEIFGNVPLRIGAILRQPDLASTFEILAEGGVDAFYRGPIARQIHDFMEREGGLITQDDLAAYQPEWQEPIDVAYRGVTVRTCPPNNEGFQILETLRLLEGFDLVDLGHNSAEYIHLVSEAVKLAIADRIQWAGDPRFQPVPLDVLLSERFITDRRTQINRAQASFSEGERWHGAGEPPVVRPGTVDGLTTHLVAVDREGTVASVTQSIGHGFGSGMVVPGTGILLNSFAHWFEIDPACPTPNLIAPGKRWAACIAPVHVLRNRGEQFWFSVSTPGSYGILHTTVQMLLNMIDFGADCQGAIEAPRFRLWEGTRMQIESRIAPPVLQELSRRGHRLELLPDFHYFVGGGQSVMIDPENGVRLAGADPRRDGYALAW